MLVRSQPTLCEFRALVVEVEAVLNDRPLEIPSSNLHDGESLTPSHLLYGRRITSVPANMQIEDEMIDPTFGEKPSEIKKAVARHQKILTTFRKAFLKPSLPALQEQQQKTRASQPSTVKEGEVVMIHDDGPRNRWEMGVIENVIPSSDGEVRVVNLHTAHGSANPPKKLYPIGVC